MEFHLSNWLLNADWTGLVDIQTLTKKKKKANKATGQVNRLPNVDMLREITFVFYPISPLNICIITCVMRILCIIVQ